MKISNNWLSKFIKTDISLELKSEILTDLGLEVEGLSYFEQVKGSFEGIVVGEVLKCFKHPNADRLKITLVNVGESDPIQIICGAKNVKKGLKVPVALINTKLYNSDGDEFLIKKNKIRGEISNGMICSEKELNIGESDQGILELNNNLKPGTKCSKIFECKKDNIFEIGLTPNRTDAMSHFGVARDLKAGLIQRGINFEWFIPSTEKFLLDSTQRTINININNKKVKKYYGLTISNLNVSESNNEIKSKLLSIGINPKNNIVDITNYVLHELGQPLHAFDADKIKGDISIKTLNKTTSFLTLEGNEINLDPDDLVIYDDEKPLCLAGIIGGKNSSISSTTKNIFLESALFNPISIRKSSKKHNINSDSSYRFERGVDPEITIFALKRTALLIKEFCGGEITSEIQEYSEPIEKRETIFLNFEKINQVIGHKIKKDNLIKIINSLEIEIVSVVEDGFSVNVPSYRVDVTRECDVIEEILRVYGFKNIKTNKKLKSIYPKQLNTKSKYELNKIIKDQLVSFGFNEIINNSLSNPKYSDFSKNLTEINKVKILNPLGIELSEMRCTLLFSCLEVISYNLKRQQNNLKLFESGNKYRLNSNKEHIQKKNTSIALTGYDTQESWNSRSKENDFFNLKGIIESVLRKYGLTNWDESNEVPDYFSEGITILKNKKKIVEFGLVKKEISHSFSINLHVFYAEFDNDMLIDVYNDFEFKVKNISKFPTSKRDFSLLLDNSVTFKEIKKLAFRLDNKILKKVTLFDVYKGKDLPKNKKSYGISFFFNSKGKTLTDIQIDKIMDKFKKEFHLNLNAELR